jgi:hypothetical protein
MASKIAIRELGKDDDYGVIKKEISIVKTSTFQTPTKGIKYLDYPLPSTATINEVTKRISFETLEGVFDGREQPRELKNRWESGKLNLTIFDLALPSIPNREKTISLSSYWYATSENVLVVPTVRTSFLQKDDTLSESKIENCVKFLDTLIGITELRNSKAFMGTIPLLPFKFSKPFIKLYLDKGFNSFVIDVGNRDILNHIVDLRSIMTEINDTIPLNKAFFYACNLAIPRFEQSLARADDFLSVFAYIDVIGNTFKPRGGGDDDKPKGPPRTKKFVKEDLYYEMSYDKPTKYVTFNQRELLKEADTVRNLVGVEKMQKYLSTKKAVDVTAIKHLDTMMGKVKIK